MTGIPIGQILSKVSTRQPLDGEKEPIVESNSSMVCTAGPGAGKTFLVEAKGTKLWSEGKDLLILAFTRSAARELLSRNPYLPVTTIHSFCYRQVGWDETLEYLGLLYRFLSLKIVPQFDWIIVDELQDLNSLELQVVLKIAKEKIFAVGDPYQSIFGFQSALGEKAFTTLERSGCTTVSLSFNYRSSPTIVKQLDKIYLRNLVSKGIKDTGLTAILCRTREEVQAVSDYLKIEGIPHRVRQSIDDAKVGKGDREYDSLGPSNLRVMTIHCSKGLEFDRVLQYQWNYIGTGEEKNIYYVAHSRASQYFSKVPDFQTLRRELNGRQES